LLYLIRIEFQRLRPHELFHSHHHEARQCFGSLAGSARAASIGRPTLFVVSCAYGVAGPGGLRRTNAGTAPSRVSSGYRHSARHGAVFLHLLCRYHLLPISLRTQLPSLENFRLSGRFSRLAFVALESPVPTCGARSGVGVMAPRGSPSGQFRMEQMDASDPDGVIDDWHPVSVAKKRTPLVAGRGRNPQG
jgi:hypothetical protein